MLEVKGLRKAYGSVVALRGVSFFVPKGLCYGLLGPNGAGKTTVISIITGTLAADEGEVLMEGRPLGTSHPDTKRRVGYVPQDLALYDDLNAIDNLHFFGVLYGLHGSALDDRVHAGLLLAGLEDRKKSPVKQFSGGMKRRLNIAAGLLHDPDLLVLDEPTVGVDPQSRNLIFEALENLRRAGKTLLYTTHYMEEAERLCQRAAIIDGGQVIAEGELSTLHRIAPSESVVRLRFASGPPETVEGLGGVLKSRWSDGALAIELSDLSRDLPGLLERLTSEGAVISDVRTERPTLEETFLHLTGRSLRDG